MDNINIGLSAGTRQKVVNALSKILADQYVLYTKTRNYHWNVTGEDFSEYHKLFADQYEALGEDIDDVGERICSLGAKTPATLGEFIKAARLKEHPGRYPSAKIMIQNRLADHEAVIRTLRNDIELCDDVDDVDTEDFLTQLMEKHEKTAWMLRSILQR